MELAQTESAPVIEQVGSGLTVTVLLLLELQPDFVTVTSNCSVAPAPAV